MTAPLVTGVVVDRTGHFAIAFGIAAGLAVIGLVSVGFIIRRIAPIDWRAHPAGQLLPALPHQG
jgi:hypothetical protein